MSDDILSLSGAQMIARFRARDLSPVEVTRAALDRIRELQPVYNAFVVVTEEEALAAARASEARWGRGTPVGLIDGLPTTVKDLLLLKGRPTLRGSRTTNPIQDWNEDSAAVARLREQGAVFLGKTTTSEFGWKGVTDSALSGVTVNPWDKTKTAGGSSGGAAAAAALGMGVMHLATDGGGSIRIPAGFCGVFGFKPTFGVVPVHPHPPPWTLWHQGPVSRTVEDAALMLSVISGPDARDFYAAPPLDIDYRQELSAGVTGLRMAYSRTLGYARVDPEVAALVDRAAARFTDLGARVEQVDLPLSDPIDIMAPLWSVALAMTVGSLSAEQRRLVEVPILELADPGFGMTALQYRALEKRREDLARRMNLLHQQFDLLLTPQLPITAFEANHEVPPGSGMKRWWQWSPFTYPFNLTQQPAAAMPCGFTSKGLPAAMQLISARFKDAIVLRAARAYETAHQIVLPEQALGSLL